MLLNYKKNVEPLLHHILDTPMIAINTMKYTIFSNIIYYQLGIMINKIKIY